MSEIRVDTISEKTSANGVAIDGLTIKDGAITATNGSAASPAYQFGDDTNTGMFRASSDTLGFSTAGSEALRIAADGDVGVGTVDPTQNLELVVSKTASIPTDASVGSTNNGAACGMGIHNENNSAVYSGLNFETRTTHASRWLMGNEWKSSYNGDLFFRARDGASSSSEILRLKSDGTVGINTADPSASWVGANNLVVSDTSSDGGITIISGTSGNGNIMFSDAQAGAFSDARGLITYLHNGDSMRFITANAEAMRIDSSQRLGIGTSSPNQLLTVKKDQNTDTAIRIANATGGTAARASIFLDVDSGGAQLMAIDDGFSTSGAYIADNVTFVSDTAMANGMTIGTRANDNNAHLRFYSKDAERARIEGGGNLLIAQTTKETRGTTLYGTGGNNAFFTATGTNLYCKTNDGSSSTTGTFISFFNNSAATGSITCTNTTDTVYGGTSDYRLKENQTEINDGITKLKQLKPYDFNWKHDSSKKVQGFFAHEFAEICPNGVVGNKDATETKTKVILDANGGVINSNIEEDDWTMGKENGTYPSDSTWEDSKVVPIYQEMDASKAIPVLTAALKEAVTKIETLEAKVTTLENN